MAQIPNLQSTNTLGVDDQAILRQGTIDKRIGLNLAGILSWARRNGYNHLGEHVTGIQFPDTVSFTTFQGKVYFVKSGVTLPYSSTSNAPSADSNLYSKGEDSLKDEIYSTVGNTNLLSNHNFLIPSSLVVNSTPQDVLAGVEIFSGVFAGSTGIQGLTYDNGYVSFTGGDLYFTVSNSGALEYVTEFAASVADFDGKPRARGVSFSMVGDEYRVTVGVDALEDTGGNPTPLGSVKFEQGRVATRHEVDTSKDGQWLVEASDFTHMFSNKRDLFDFCLKRIQSLGGGKLVLERGVIYNGLDMHFCNPAIPVTLDLNGSTLKQADGLGNWFRLLTSQDEITGQPVYSSDYDSPLWEIMNGTLDGNRDNRSPFTGFEKEQSHLIFWGADANKKGRARLKLHPSVKLINSCGDGVLVYNNCDLIADYAYSRACFRGGITASGGYSKISARGFTDDIAPNAISINLEFDSLGFGGTRSASVDLTGVTTNNSVELDIRDGGVVDISRMNMMQGSSITFTGDGTSNIYGKNSKLRVTGQSGASGFFADIGTMRLENPTITAEFSGSGGESVTAVAVRWSLASSGVIDRLIELVNPKILTFNKQPTDTAIGIDTSPYDRDDNNWIRAVGRGFISSGFDLGIDSLQGGAIEIGDDMRIDASDRAIRMLGNSTYKGVLKLGTVKTRVAQSISFLTVNAASSGALIVEARDAVFAQSVSGFTGGGSPLANISTFGGRWIHGTDDPTVTLVPGLVGDTYSKTDDGRRFRATVNNNTGATQWTEM